ncbi:hypothetical protein ACFVVM_32545 [Nocardia sp. NPDC058176]|uniref:hypothetical protein n=1 Tax=Nocardia sp. NPDC058176 TaxID=3346368 RepID=UPI0036D8B19C
MTKHDITTQAGAGTPVVPTFRIVSPLAPAPFRIDDDALVRWVSRTLDENTGRFPDLPSVDDERPGSRLAALVEDAMDLGVLDGDRWIDLVVFGEDDDAGPGFYILVRSAGHNGAATGLSTGWTELELHDADADQVPSRFDMVSIVSFYLDQVCEQANRALASIEYGTGTTPGIYPARHHTFAPALPDRLVITAEQIAHWAEGTCLSPREFAGLSTLLRTTVLPAVITKLVTTIAECREPLRSSPRQLPDRLRASMHQGYTPEQVNDTFGLISDRFGVRVVCVWDYIDDTGFGGDSDLYIEVRTEAGINLAACDEQLLAWLTLPTTDPDAPTNPGDPARWQLAPTIMPTTGLTRDGLHNYAHTDER